MVRFAWKGNEQNGKQQEIRGHLPASPDLVPVSLGFHVRLGRPIQSAAHCNEYCHVQIPLRSIHAHHPLRRVCPKLRYDEVRTESPLEVPVLVRGVHNRSVANVHCAEPRGCQHQLHANKLDHPRHNRKLYRSFGHFRV